MGSNPTRPTTSTRHGSADETRWDLIREVLIEVEALAEPDRPSFAYGVGDSKGAQALLLWKAGYFEAIEMNGLDSGAAILRRYIAAVSRKLIRPHEPSETVGVHVDSYRRWKEPFADEWLPHTGRAPVQLEARLGRPPV